MTELCPAQIQDVLLQNVDEASADYEKLKQKILTWVSNKVANECAPMDVGRVVRGGDEEAEDYDVDAVSWRTQCFNCQGWGRRARDCPSEKRQPDSKGRVPPQGKPKGEGKGGKPDGNKKGAG